MRRASDQPARPALHPTRPLTSSALPPGGGCARVAADSRERVAPSPCSSRVACLQARAASFAAAPARSCFSHRLRRLRLQRLRLYCAPAPFGRPHCAQALIASEVAEVVTAEAFVTAEKKMQMAAEVEASLHALTPPAAVAPPEKAPSASDAEADSKVCAARPTAAGPEATAAVVLLACPTL
eukprot:2790861-Prymnesium_polylepis.1